MIRVIKDFLPKSFFNSLLTLVEHESFKWEWHNNTIVNPVSKTGDDNFKFGTTIYQDGNLAGGFVKLPLFETFRPIADFQNKIVPLKKLIKLKLNLYPNQGKQVKHGKHTDVAFHGGKPDLNVITSVFNFHTCNGYTVIEDDKKEQIVPSVANQIVIFDNALHFGVTQSDIPRRIVLNINVLKK